MAGAVQLRVIDGGLEPRVAVAVAPDLPGVAESDRIPVPVRRFSASQMAGAALVSLALHAGLFAWGMQQGSKDEARAAGGSEDVVVTEGVSVIMIDSLPSDFSDGTEALPEAQPIVSAMAAAVVADDLVQQDQDEAPQEAVDAAAVPAESIAPVENAEASAPAVPDAAASVPEDVIATAMENDRQPLAAVSDAPAIAPDAPSAPLADEAISDAVAAAVDPAPEPVVDAAIATADATAEPAVDDATAVADARREPIAVEDVVARPVPDETRVAAIEPPEDVATVPPMPKPRPVAPKPKKKPAVQPRAESPRPAPRSQQQAGSIAEQAARGRSAGKAGADGRSTTERGKADVSGYRAKLAAHLRRFRTYPPEARSRGISGTVTVRFTVNARGVVTGAAVTASSGERVLDAAATAMVNRASPFPPIPANLGTKTMTVTAPVRFGLR